MAHIIFAACGTNLISTFWNASIGTTVKRQKAEVMPIVVSSLVAMMSHTDYLTCSELNFFTLLRTKITFFPFANPRKVIETVRRIQPIM